MYPKDPFAPGAWREAEEKLVAEGKAKVNAILNRANPGAEANPPKPVDPVNPGHYQGDLVMRIIERFNLGFRLGNVIKYILRANEKAGLEDLKKARWYLDREIQAQEGKVGTVE